MSTVNRVRAAVALVGLVLGLALAACAGGHSATVTATKPPPSPASTFGGTAYQLGFHDAQSDVHNGVGPTAGQTGYRWCDLQLYGGDGAVNDGGNAAAWFSGCVAGIGQIGVTP